MGRQLLLMLVLVTSSAEGAFEQAPRGARAVGLGGATVSVGRDLWAPFINPSCLSSMAGANIAAEFVPALFGMRELKRGAIAMSGATPLGACAFSISGFGFELYREAALGIAVARDVNERAALGIGVNWYSLAIRGYGSGHALGLDLGLLVHVAQGISYGFAIHNLNRPSLGSEEEALPQTMTMGVCVQPVPDALVAISIGKDTHYPVELSVGLECTVEHLVALRLGASNEPSTIAAGMGIRTSLLCLDYAYSMHPDLGGTHCISISFALPWP